MYKLTRRDQAWTAAKRWRDTYPEDENVQLLDGRNASVILRSLYGLGLHPTPEEVEAVIGNGGWTRLRCTECGKSADTVVIVGCSGSSPDDAAQLCETCLRDAVDLLG